MARTVGVDRADLVSDWGTDLCVDVFVISVVMLELNVVDALEHSRFFAVWELEHALFLFNSIYVDGVLNGAGGSWY